MDSIAGLVHDVNVGQVPDLPVLRIGITPKIQSASGSSSAWEVPSDPQRHHDFPHFLGNANATQVDIRLSRDHGDIILEVRDNGRGIAAQRLSTGK
jgi:hypothetical protein